MFIESEQIDLMLKSHHSYLQSGNFLQHLLLQYPIDPEGWVHTWQILMQKFLRLSHLSEWDLQKIHVSAATTTPFR